MGLPDRVAVRGGRRRRPARQTADLIIPEPAPQQEGRSAPTPAARLWAVNPVPAASRTAASSVACSAANQASASSAVAGSPTIAPGRGGAGSTGAKYGSISLAAAWAVCR